jgi:hypothetical protein
MEYTEMDSTETTPATAPFDGLPIHIRIAGLPPVAAIWRGEDGWSPWSGALVLDVLDSREAVETGLEELLTRPAPQT